MGVKSGAAGDSVQMGSLCHPLPTDDDDSDDSGGNLFFSLTFLCFFLIQYNAKLAARFVGGSITGINEVSEAQGFNNFEGKVFENGKIVIYKKGMKFNANGARLK